MDSRSVPPAKSEGPDYTALFNTYRLADHKEAIIDLLMRVTRVSVETMQIVDAMRQLAR
jgi:hypothetical protein